ncbi:MAG: hypothetical protein ACJ8G3_12610 [Burkholderiaceae bacterium]
MCRTFFAIIAGNCSVTVMSILAKNFLARLFLLLVAPSYLASQPVSGAAMIFSFTDYLIAALVLVALAIWFERWWRK